MRLLTLLFVFALLTGSAAAQTVHFIGVADVHGNLGENSSNDLHYVCGNVRFGLHAEQLAFYKLPEDILDGERYEQNVTPEAVLQLIQGLKNVRPTDAVVFYYTGLGAMDETKGLFYVLSDKNEKNVHKPLLKSEVITAIQKHNPRLTVIINDCCSVKSDYKRSAEKPKPEAMPNKIAVQPCRGSTEKAALPLFQSLFLESKGLVDISAAQDGENSFCFAASKRPYSILTRSFVEQLQSKKDSKMTWEEFFPLVQSATKAKAEKELNGEKQIPKAFFAQP